MYECIYISTQLYIYIYIHIYIYIIKIAQRGTNSDVTLVNSYIPYIIYHTIHTDTYIIYIKCHVLLSLITHMSAAGGLACVVTPMMAQSSTQGHSGVTVNPPRGVTVNVSLGVSHRLFSCGGTPNNILNGHHSGPRTGAPV